MKDCCNEAKQRFGGDGNYYCGKHMHHMYRHGKIIEHHRRSPIDYYIENKVAYIKLYDNKGVHIAITQIDEENLPSLLDARISYGSSGYAVVTKDGVRTLLHRLIMKPKDEIVDHINGDRLDNRKENLRLVTNQQNQFNQHNDGRGSNPRKGVSYRKDRKKWRAYINIDEKQINLGMFLTEEEAIKAREEAEIKYFGEYRRV